MTEKPTFLEEPPATDEAQRFYDEERGEDGDRKSVV